MLGIIQILTNRATQGVAECERALALDRNLAHAHAWIGLAKMFIGRATETETHVDEALRLSPRDTRSYIWLLIAGLAVSFQEVVHSALTEEAEVAEASDSEGRTEWTPIRMRR
jgi:hypothetical protein